MPPSLAPVSSARLSAPSRVPPSPHLWSRGVSAPGLWVPTSLIPGPSAIWSRDSPGDWRQASRTGGFSLGRCSASGRRTVFCSHGDAGECAEHSLIRERPGLFPRLASSRGRSPTRRRSVHTGVRTLRCDLAAHSCAASAGSSRHRSRGPGSRVAPAVRGAPTLVHQEWLAKASHLRGVCRLKG